MGICLVRLPSKSLFLGAEVLCFLLVYNERPSGKNSKGRKLQRFPTLFRCLLLIFLFTIWVGKFSSLVSSHASQRYFFLSPFILLQLLFLIFTDLNKPLFVRSYQSAQKSQVNLSDVNDLECAFCAAWVALIAKQHVNGRFYTTVALSVTMNLGKRTILVSIKTATGFPSFILNTKTNQCELCEWHRTWSVCQIQ